MKTYYVLLTLLGVSNFATAQDLQYDPEGYLAAEAWKHAEYEAKGCMHETASMLLMQGIRDQEKIVATMIKFCSSGLRATFNTYKIDMFGATENYLEVIAYGELLKIPGVVINYPTKAKK